MKAWHVKSRVAVEVRQWCNNWFSVEMGGQPKIVRPTMLAFSRSGADIIIENPNNGTLLQEFAFKLDTYLPSPYFYRLIRRP